MITNDEVYDIIKPVIQDATGLRMIIPARSNVPSPTGSYGVIDVLTNTSERGQANILTKYIKSDRQVERTILPQVQISVVVEFYRDKAHHYARQLLQLGKRDSARWELFKNGLSVRGTGGIIDLTALQSNNYEQRARITIELWGNYKFIERINTVERLYISTENEAGQHMQTAHIDGAS